MRHLTIADVRQKPDEVDARLSFSLYPYHTTTMDPRIDLVEVLIGATAIPPLGHERDPLWAFALACLARYILRRAGSPLCDIYLRL